MFRVWQEDRRCRRRARYVLPVPNFANSKYAMYLVGAGEWQKEDKVEIKSQINLIVVERGDFQLAEESNSNRVLKEKNQDLLNTI